MTDAWLAYKYHLGNSHQHKSIGIAEFAAVVCKDCLNNKFHDNSPTDEPMQIFVPGQQQLGSDSISLLSSFTSPSGKTRSSPSSDSNGSGGIATAAVAIAGTTPTAGAVAGTTPTLNVNTQYVQAVDRKT